ncbi:hypothetical protein C8J55DRAFT_496059 [Lentinula edodes]|uniref:Uncharacterized protein n=1 Tax=Lentinula lateritia TaxID=40482 RepID=A0A9W9B1Z8_9AGAR|nr:hypothetical protein C8J55DRAFT_496059 [Lentinula edodes]
MSRFTQYSEDSTRLPVGLQRIAYDADTQQYTFRDENGRLYYSASGESYGHLTTVGSAARAGEVAMTEPKPKPQKRSQTSPPTLPAPKSFYDILPPESIASAGSTTSLKSSPSPSSPSPSSSPTSPSSSSPTSPRPTPSPRSRFIAAAKRSTIPRMPRMQSVVQGLMRREVTVGKRRGDQTRTHTSGHQDQDDDRAGLLRTHSVVSRSSTVRTSQSSGVTLVEETGEGY